MNESSVQQHQAAKLAYLYLMFQCFLRHSSMASRLRKVSPLLCSALVVVLGGLGPSLGSPVPTGRETREQLWQTVPRMGPGLEIMTYMGRPAALPMMQEQPFSLARKMVHRNSPKDRSPQPISPLPFHSGATSTPQPCFR